MRMLLTEDGVLRQGTVAGNVLGLVFPQVVQGHEGHLVTVLVVQCVVAVTGNKQMFEVLACHFSG